MLKEKVKEIRVRFACWSLGHMLRDEQLTTFPWEKHLEHDPTAQPLKMQDKIGKDAEKAFATFLFS